MDIINLIKEKGMSVARINMLEFETEDDLNKRADLYGKDAPTLFPTAEILVTIKACPTTECRSLSIQISNQLRSLLSEGINNLKLQKYSHERLGI